MLKKHNIVLIILYMGKWPWYFPHFLHSCKYNSDIDFLIFSDNTKLINKIPHNVQIINYSIFNFKNDFKRIVGFEACIENNYKLCDFKPTYGYIFYDKIKNYDFWGYCDIDIIWGNIRTFMTNKLLNKYDIISARNDYLTGCFSLYRNTHYFRTLFLKSKDYKKVYSQPMHFCFDETNFAFHEFENGYNYDQINTEIESMTHLVKKFDDKKNLKAYFEFQILEGTPGNMIWNKGHLTYKNKFIVMFYHLIILKTIYTEKNNINRTIPEKFKININNIKY